MNILQLCILGVAVLFIGPVNVMSNPSEDPSVMVFSLMLILDRLWTIGQCFEVYWRGIGQKERKPSALRDAILYATVLPFYVAAFVVAAYEYGSIHGSVRRNLATAPNDYESPEEAPVNDIPIILTFCGFLGYIASLATTIICCFPSEGRHKEMYVNPNLYSARRRLTLR
jgi:hypothetical protein